MFLKEFFYFQKSDRKVILTLLLLATLAILTFWLIGSQEKKTQLTAADSLMIEQSFYNSRNYDRKQIYYQTEKQTTKLFPFDPNTADSTQLLRLGLSPWQVRNIYKYRAKGGIYRKPSDFARLYGLTIKQFKEMEPYIQISVDYQPATSLFKEEQEQYIRDTVRFPVKIKPTERIVLNTADTTQLKKVPGIGSGWARQIVNYRERLGGFHDVGQLLEIEGFPEEALSYFVIQHPQIRKLNVNKLTLNQLRKHPYINFYQAKAIMDYRRLKGSLKSLNDLQLIKDFTPEAIHKLNPYIEY